MPPRQRHPDRGQVRRCRPGEEWTIRRARPTALKSNPEAVSGGRSLRTGCVQWNSPGRRDPASGKWSGWKMSRSTKIGSNSPGSEGHLVRKRSMRSNHFRRPSNVNRGVGRQKVWRTSTHPVRSRTQSRGVVRCRSVFRRGGSNSPTRNPAYRRSRPTFCIPKTASCGQRIAVSLQI